MPEILAQFLFRHPVKMLGERRIGRNRLKTIQCLAKDHFIIEIVNTIMAKPANINASL